MKSLISPETKVLNKLLNINVALFAGFDSKSLSHFTDEITFKSALETEIEKLVE